MRRAFPLLVGILIAYFCLQASGVKEHKQMEPAECMAPKAAPALKVNTDFGKIPLQFIPNKGQMNEQVAFYIQGRDKTIFFTEEGLTFLLNGPQKPNSGSPDQRNPADGAIREDAPLEKGLTDRWVVKLDFLGANEDVEPVGLETSGAVFSYFTGEPDEWKAGLAAFSKIIYPDLWPGIDLVFYGTFNRMKYEFIVSPGADPSLIRLGYRGAESVDLTMEGRLAIRTPMGSFEDEKPVAYQNFDGKRMGVAVSYSLAALEEGEASSAALGVANSIMAENAARTFWFSVEDYDRNRPLILDPAVLVYCGYIGGSGANGDYGGTFCDGISVDGIGNVYVTGFTDSLGSSFPVAVGPDLTHNGGTYDSFVAKVNAEGTALVYCGYIGGTGNNEVGSGIAIDAAGCAYITGYTASTESSFPVVVGPDTTYNGGGDVFVAKIKADGTGLEYCGYIGGSGGEDSYAIAVDSLGAAYLTGYTASTESTFPITAGSLDTTHNGGTFDAFVAKVKADGTALDYCTYLGGSGYDRGYGIDVDNSGHAYIAGTTPSDETTFPVTIGPDLTYNGGSYDAFVAKLNSEGTALTYCGYIGGVGVDEGRGIAVDHLGNSYITGQAGSSPATFPVVVGPKLTAGGGGSEGFAAKIDTNGGTLVYCGYIGGSGNDHCTGIAVDDWGNAYITGDTYSSQSTFPVTAGPDLTHNGGVDAFIAKVRADGTAFIYCGYIGGAGTEYGTGIAVDILGNAYIVGNTTSGESTFPVTVGPDVTYNGGAYDVFVAKVNNGIRVDFNMDGQEDILWRYHGTGGYNRAWYLGNSEGAGSALTLGAVAAPISDTAGFLFGSMVEKKVPMSLRAAETFANRMKMTSQRSSRNPMAATGRQTRPGIVDDPRRAGGVLSEPSQMSIADPRQVKLGLDVTSSADVKLASTPSVLGGGDVMPVGDLNWQIVGTGDFNNDTHVDILWRYNGAGGANVVWYMNGVNWTGSAALIPVSDLSWKIVGTGDFNNDTYVDILWRNGATGSNVVWYMEGATWIGSAVLLGVSDPTWQIAGTGDFNKDGSVDILWRYGGSGGYDVVWYMDGVNWSSSDELIHVADTTWQIAGTGDYNNDGNVDILWRYNGAGGWNVIWYMNGVNWVESAELIPVSDLNWKIVSR